MLQGHIKIVRFKTDSEAQARENSSKRFFQDLESHNLATATTIVTGSLYDIDLLTQFPLPCLHRLSTEDEPLTSTEPTVFSHVL
jgi:hypothetical protein